MQKVFPNFRVYLFSGKRFKYNFTGLHFLVWDSHFLDYSESSVNLVWQSSRIFGLYIL